MRGQDGPWAALVEDDQVVSLAHCARLTDLAAEVGVQTEDAHRGQGLAAVAVAGWVQRMRPQGRRLFYSALEANDASHRVAGKCRATPLGRLIRLYVKADSR
jgi:predicted GNAT family acetyltransferase